MIPLKYPGINSLHKKNDASASSGRRSKLAAESLAKLGYTNVKEFGGIIDWPYEVEK